MNNGTTLASAFSLPFSLKMSDLSRDVTNTIRVKLMHLILLIIDEISVVGAEFNGKIDRRLKQIFYSKLPYGNVPVLVLGDFFQLPPMFDRYIFEPRDNVYDYLVGPILWRNFKFYELTEVVRQDNVSFITALHNLSRGKLTEVDFKLFLSRVVHKKFQIERNGCIS